MDKEIIPTGKIETGTKKGLNAKFERLLGDKLELIPPGLSFSSHLEGIDYIVIIPPHGGQVNVIIFYKAENKSGKMVEKSETASIYKDGTFALKLPRQLRHLDGSRIYNEVLDDLDSIGIGKWISLDRILQEGENLEIIPPGDWHSPLGVKGEERSRAPLDSDRMRFFSKQSELLYEVHPGALTRILYGRADRFGTGQPVADLSDYHAFIFPKGVMFENAVCENNIYYYTFSEPVDETTIIKIKTKGLTLDELRPFLQNIGFHTERQKNKSLLKLEGRRYPEHHPDYNLPANKKQPFYDRLQRFIDNTLI